MATMPLTATPRGKTKVSRKRGQLVPALLFLLPALLGFLAFFAWPAARGIYLSFTDYNLLSDPTWVGLANYQDIAGDSVFWRSMVVTLQYVLINIVVQTIAALGLAVLLHRFTKSMVIRGVVMLPYLIANVIVALVWYWLADYNLGLINSALDAIGLDRIGFFGDQQYAMTTIALVNVWRHLGYTTLLIFAGLQAIPGDVYEAAAVDGAGEWRVFRSITLPLLRPVLAFVLVVTVVGSFQIFDTIAVTTQGGPVDATNAITYYIYDRAFTSFDFGYASALSVILMLILAVIALVQMRVLRANQSDLER